MPLNLYPSVRSSGSVPKGWKPAAGGTLKYPVRNRAVLRELRRLQAGRWQKVIKQGNVGESTISNMRQEAWLASSS